MNVLKIILSFFFVSGLSYATPEVIASNAVVYKTIGNVALNLHIYNPKNFDEKKTHNVIIFFHGGVGIMVVIKRLNVNRCILHQGVWLLFRQNTV